ncbi:MAG: hypothetical protein J5674_01505 [Candidatus Methanomethylophilaceae archaeon]|nr:hypothetical protein [Candidatus Methanomethylophilaceae archaeon]
MTCNDIMAFLRENAYPYYCDTDSFEKGSWQDRYFNALLQSLPEETLAQVGNRLVMDPSCPRILFLKAEMILTVKVEGRHAALTTRTLLRYYTDKKSRKVSMAVKELMRRFPSETQESQRTILRAFLSGGRKEMEWAGRHLRDHWTRSLSGPVAERWKATRNPVLGQVALRHLPTAFLLEEQEALAEALGYAAVCARLGSHPAFRLDSARLTVPEYFYVMAKLDAGRSEAVNVPLVMEFMLDEYLDEGERLSPGERDRLLWSMGRIGMTEALMKVLPELRRREEEERSLDRIVFGDQDSPDRMNFVGTLEIEDKMN